MDSTSFKHALLAASAFAALACSAGGAEAQGADASRTTIEEVVITARRTSEELQTTPVAVTALSAAALNTAQISRVSDLVRKAPALSIATGGPGGPGVANLSIRGQTAVGGNSTQDTAVATYLDGIYVARQTSGNLGMFDIGQAEVLRGPQGTLFGRNTTGGALNMTTVQPDGHFGGYLRGEYGNYDAVKLEGAVTAPLAGEELSVRLAGRYASRDGYYDNPILGTEVNNLDHFWAVRATVKWAPDDMPFSLTVSADRSDWSDDGQAFAIVAVNTALAPGSLPYLVGPGGGGRYDQTYQNYFPTSINPNNRTGVDDGKNAGVSATLDIDLGSWNLKSITAWRSADANNLIDIDGSPAVVHGTYSSYRQKQWSEEVQASATIGNLDFQAGFMYFYEDGSEQSVSRSPVAPSGLQNDLGFFSSKSTSVYIQANYSFTDKLRATAGYRYTWDKRDLTRAGRSDFANVFACGAGIPVTPTGCALPLSAAFDYPAWLVGLDYKLTETAFIYVKASQASLSGGFNTRFAPIGRESFAPEERREAEVGAKIDALDRRLRANLALFIGTTDGAQRQASGLQPNGTPTQFTQNAGKVKTKGAELELTAIPWEGMQVDAGVAYLDAKYKKGSFLETRAGGVVVDRSGELVPLSPEWSFNIGLTQKVDLGIGVLTGHVDYTYFDDKAIMQTTSTPGASAAVIAVDNVVNRTGVLDSYSLVNARVALRLRNGLELSVWGRNLADKEYYTYAFPALYGAPGFGVVTQAQGEPRTYGVGLSYEF